MTHEPCYLAAAIMVKRERDQMANLRTPVRIHRDQLVFGKPAPERSGNLPSEAIAGVFPNAVKDLGASQLIEALSLGSSLTAQ